MPDPATMMPGVVLSDGADTAPTRDRLRAERARIDAELGRLDLFETHRRGGKLKKGKKQRNPTAKRSAIRAAGIGTAAAAGGEILPNMPELGGAIGAVAGGLLYRLGKRVVGGKKSSDG